MKKIFITILILLFSFQCKIFKPSNLDPSEDLGSLQSLLRLLSLADAFNTYSQTVVFMKFTDANGTPYSTGTVEYSVFNEADENGVPVSLFGGNIQPLTATLDANGRGFLFFSERGIANLTVKNSGNTFVGAATFRIYNGITKQTFSILSQTGATQFILEDLANYRNGMAASQVFTPLGSVNGRQFIYLQIQTSFISFTDNDYKGYIISSADGETYDQVIAIDGVSISTKGATQKRLKISLPSFDGNQYVFFLSEQTDLSGIYQSNKDLVLRVPAFFTPSSVAVEALGLPTNYHLFTQDDRNWLYPALYAGSGRFLATPYFSSQYRPTLISFNSATTSDLNLGFNCSVSNPELHMLGYQVFNANGVSYLQCPNSISYGSATLPFRTIRISDLALNTITFDAGVSQIESNIFSYKGQLIALAGGGPYNGYTFPTGSYTSTNPTIAVNSTTIAGLSFSLTLTDTSSRLKSIKGSLNTDYMILASNGSFSAPTVIIYKSTDSFASATTIGALPMTYFAGGITNPEQLQSANGKLNYSGTISAGTGIDSRPVYLTYFTNDDGTWEGLPRLIKIR
ncbi:hypothetical protein EHQ68_07815 [Leptospira congkakensis]|uniref:Uncharacterized protein n=1 Tax=Leptospira congkakensis TaxID=2484932 RepID=A0A4Z1AJ23_9LEPT|nr:hypothetical protein [Leptospira congkakensis]TGL88540.1 hypothetical protein EHQ69_13885 [Leptospira congkakensis]TGL89126.1 hypothetical protein EHQ68_07815 [Leptospira congkakensis]TGL97092.1 hypothetical protein EHQ70_07310 [Leptospira congkakensis]